MVLVLILNSGPIFFPLCNEDRISVSEGTALKVPVIVFVAVVVALIVSVATSIFVSVTGGVAVAVFVIEEVSLGI